MRKISGLKRIGRLLLVAVFCCLLLGCQTEVYKGLTEDQVNSMLSTLLKRGIQAEKIATGKTGYTLAVDEAQLVQALEVLKENSLPREQFQNLGSVFTGQGMISSASEEQARLAFAISQELSDTFSRIDGVLTSRVHIVLGASEQAGIQAVPPSAAVFLRHTPDSPVVNLVAKIRELTAKAVPSLDFDHVSVMLVPVRETVSVPLQPTPTFLGLPFLPDNGTPYILVGALLLLLGVLVVLGVGGYTLWLRRKQQKTETA